MFIPIGDDNSRRRTFPFVVWGLVLLNAYVWYLELKYGQPFMATYAAIPFEISHGQDLISPQFIALHNERILIPQGAGPDPIYLTIFTSMFMHGSWMHIIGNMVYLLIFADQIEDEMGHLPFLLFYLLAGVGACLAQTYADPNSIIPCVGASGAIAGALGAYLILHPTNRVRVLFFRSLIVLPAWIVLGLWIVLQGMGHVGGAAEGARSGVAYMAHIGGFIVGFIVSIAMRLRSKRSRHRNSFSR